MRRWIKLKNSNYLHELITKKKVIYFKNVYINILLVNLKPKISKY